MAALPSSSRLYVRPPEVSTVGLEAPSEPLRGLICRSREV